MMCRGAVTGFLHGGDNRLFTGDGRVERNVHAVFQQIDADFLYAVQRSHGPVHPAGAGRTGHTGDIEAFFFHKVFSGERRLAGGVTGRYRVMPL